MVFRSTDKHGPVWIALSVGTFLVLAFVGTRIIQTEPYRTLWPLAAGLLSVVTWFFVRRWWENRH